MHITFEIKHCFHVLQLTTASGDAEHHLSLVTVLQGSLEPSILGEGQTYQYTCPMHVCVRHQATPIAKSVTVQS